MARSTFCDHCEREVETASYTFRRHQGMLVMFQHGHIKGYFCRDCASKWFWKWTPLTLLIGWPGYISVFAAPITALSNTVQFVHSRFLPKPDPASAPPLIETADADKLHASLPKILNHFQQRRGHLHLTAQDLADEVGVRPAQMIAFLRNLSRASQLNAPERPRARGFEVLPAAAADMPSAPAIPETNSTPA